jgi:5-methyltetrahydrofolate--homocysteine methyltransferase
MTPHTAADTRTAPVTLPPLEAHPFLDALGSRTVILDGAMGTSLQEADLTAADFGGDALEGCNEVLVRTRPDVIGRVHRDFLEVGCHAVETDTFGGAPWVLDEYGLGEETEELNRRAAELAREACDAFATPGDPRWVVGSIGPGTRSPTLSLGKDGRRTPRRSGSTRWRTATGVRCGASSTVAPTCC